VVWGASVVWVASVKAKRSSPAWWVQAPLPMTLNSGGREALSDA
jgi:hypothetical protein